MNKEKLVRFINKYHLGGLVESAILKSDSTKKVLSTTVIDKNKTLLGAIKVENWDFEDSTLGIYDTEKLLGLLKVLDDSGISCHVKKAEEKALSMNVKDSYSSVDFMLSDPSIIQQAPPLKDIPTFNVSIKLTPDIVKKLLIGTSVLADEGDSKFTVISTKDVTKIVINHNTTNLTNRVTVPVTCDFKDDEDMENISFNATHFAQILIANQECETGTFEVSNGGLAKLTFNVDDFSTIYYIVNLDNA